MTIEQKKAIVKILLERMKEIERDIDEKVVSYGTFAYRTLVDEYNATFNYLTTIDPNSIEVCRVL